MSTIRPEGATHTDIAGYYYKCGDELNWYRHDGIGWFGVGTLPAGTLSPLAPVQVVELEKFDAPTAPRAVHTDAPMPSLAPAFSPVLMACIDHEFKEAAKRSGDQMQAYGDACQKIESQTPFTAYFAKYQFVGSRITCNPPPLDTDQDVLVLVHQSNHAEMERKILEAGFVKEGSLPADSSIDAAACNVFHSYRKCDMNYIVTTDGAFYQRFSTATELARKYNLMEKSDRIQLFQAVLYGKWWA